MRSPRAFMPQAAIAKIPDVVVQLFRFHKEYVMNKIVKRFVVVVLALMMTEAAIASRNGGARHDWEPVIKAIIMVESGGDARAKSGNSVGAMQITPILVKECNNILRKRKSKKRYTLADRYSVKKSKEMFLLMQSEFNKENNVEKAIRAWNGGNKYSKKATQRYYEKVMKHLK